MNLYIDPSGGIAGDMFAAALIDAGADSKKVINAMLGAARTLGQATVELVKTIDGSSRLHIEVEHHHGHLSSSQALHLLGHLFDDFKVQEQYRGFGLLMLRSLIKAEKIAHETYDFDMDHHHHDAHAHTHTHGHTHVHSHEEPEAWLHEAQDILIDVMGAVIGLQELKAPVSAILTAPVSYGGGSITFSHGTMKVPAPATHVMIESMNLPVKAGPIDTELFTPTGAALLTALSSFEIQKLPQRKIVAEGFSRGTKDLDIAPLRVVFM